MKLIDKYKNGNYNVLIFSDGTKVRHTEDEEFIPEFPENIDICISHKCDGGCKFCYENCTPQGEHGEIMNERFINSLHKGMELALNGNDLSHPYLVAFLSKLKEKKVIANLTVNQIHFERFYYFIKELLDKKLIWGLGISLREPTDAFINLVKTIPNAVIHTINGILTENDLNRLANHDLKILILGYKTTGRGLEYRSNNLGELMKNTTYLGLMLPTIVKEGWFKNLSFDNLAIKQLDVKRLMTEEEWNNFYMGDDGTFMFYIDLVNQTFSKNSVIAKVKSIPINGMTVDEMFKVVKTTNWED